MHAPNAALLIDFDNVTMGIRSDLTKELRTLLNSDIIKGKVAVQRAYADWRRYPQYIVPLAESSIDLIFAPAYGSSKKNATDIRLAIDAIELVFTRPEIGTFILLSGDCDFSSMVIKLKEYGKYVIGVGIRESSSDLLIQNCDEYYCYNALAGLTKEVDTPSIQRDPWELAARRSAQMARNGDVMRSDRLKQVMQQIDPNFDERNAGFNRFSKFVIEAGQQGRASRSPSSTTASSRSGRAPRRWLRCRAPAAPARPGAHRRGDAARAARGARTARPGPRTESARGRRGRRGRGRGDRHGDVREPPTRSSPAARAARPADGSLSLARAFQLMSQALSELRGPVSQEALRLRMAAMHGREDALLDPTRFPRLLRQANDAEVADVRKVGDDDYEITGRPHRGARCRPSPRRPRSAAPAGAIGRRGRAERTARLARAGRAGRGARTTASGFGVRFRRGSRGGLRAGEIPLIGVVQMESPAEPEPAEAAGGGRRAGRRDRPQAGAPARAPRKKGRGRHRGQGRGAGRSAGRDRGAAAPAPAQATPSPGPEEGGVKPQRRAATLPVSFFDRPADVVARELLGALVVSRLGGVRTSARIVETEAYLGYRDPASHGYLHRRNERNAALFGPPGSWYVYLSYGIHWCANLVCEAEGTASAVLLRALEPVEGVEAMRERRGAVDDRQLCSGPGKLCQALGITRATSTARMMPASEVVVVRARRQPAVEVLTTPRIGITKAADWPLRFLVARESARVRGAAGRRATVRSGRSANGAPKTTTGSALSAARLACLPLAVRLTCTRRSSPPRARRPGRTAGRR